MEPKRLIGRDAQLKFLKDKLLEDEVHLLQVYGQPCVGKSALIFEVLNLIKYEVEEKFFSCKVIFVQENEHWENIKSKIFPLENPNSSRLLVILKNFHLISPESLENFQEFCCQMPLEENKMCVIIIHQRLFEFDFQGMVSEKLHLCPLKDTHAKMLFCKNAFKTDPQFQVQQGDDEHINYLVDQCSGLPGLIINLADKWREWSSNASLAEFCEYLRKHGNVFSFMKDVICPHKEISKSFGRFIKHLPEELKKPLAELSIFRGQLSIKDMTYMIGGGNELTTKFEVALPLVFHGFLKKNNQKFQVQPLIRDMANQQLYHMYTEDTNHLKFVHVVGNVLLKAEEIYRKNMPVQTLGIVKDNWDNIEFLLRQGIHEKNNSEAVSVLFQVAVEAGDVISICCPREAKEFFWDCLNAAEQFGTTEQKAMMQVRYGQSLTNEGGAGGEKYGMVQYQKAIATLKEEGKDFRILCLLNSMAYNYYRQGNLHDACKCAGEAMKMKVRDEDPEVANHIKINSASIYAYTLIYLGHHKKAKQILLDNLENIRDSNHMSISVMLNSLGLAEEGPDGCEAEALKWYTKSLANRRKMSVLKPENLVIPLCHIANLASKKSKKYELALKYLNEAKEIMMKKCWIHIHSATIQYTFGVVYMRMNSINNALECFGDALTIHQQLHANHYFNATILNWISHCYLLKNDISWAAKKFKEAQKMMTELIDMRPNACYLSQPLEHLVRMTIPNKDKSNSHLMELIKELQRLVSYPDLDEILVRKYNNVLEVYENCKNDGKCILEKIPMTCTVCTEILEHKICLLQKYKEIVNMVSYTENMIHERQPISDSIKFHQPRQIVYFPGAPLLPDPDPDPDSPDSLSVDHILQNDNYISNLNDQTLYESYSGDDSSTYLKDLDSIDTSSSDYSDTELICKTRVYGKQLMKRPPVGGRPPLGRRPTLGRRPPLQLVEHADESSFDVSMNDNLKISPSSSIKNVIPEMNERATAGITDTIFADQSREYKNISLQKGWSCPLPFPQDEKHYSNSSGCETRMMTSKNATLKFKEDFQNMKPKINLGNSHTISNIGHFQNPENEMKQSHNIILKVDHNSSLQNVKTKMESVTDPNSSKQHPAMIEETDSQNRKDQKRLLHENSTSVLPQDLFITYQNVASVGQQNLAGTLEQNKVLQSYNVIDSNSSKQHPGMTEETDSQNRKDQKRFLHQQFTSILPHVPQNTQHITGTDLFVTYQNGDNVEQQNLTDTLDQNTLDQNTVLENYNTPNIEVLLVDNLEKFELNIPNLEVLNYGK